MTADQGADHLAVLVHGLWGNPSHLNHIRDRLRQQYSADQLHILVAKTNADNHTYDGIEVGGERIVYEVEQEIARLEEEHGTKIKKISIAGYSLGGLVSRYAIGLMYSSGLFDRIEPVNFTTFATPHLGVRTPKVGYRSYMFNYMGARTLSTSGQQMFLIDSFRDTGRPLLSVMADPNSVFIKALEQFRNKWIYANTVNDRSVPYYTAMISATDPFVSLSAITPHFLNPQPEPGNVILDPNHSVSPRQQTAQTPWQGAVSTFRALPVYIVLATLIPIAVPAFVLNAVFQTYRSNQRLRHHESGKAFNLDKYRVKLLEEAQHLQDRVYERVANEQPEEYLPTPPPECSSPSSLSAGSKPTTTTNDSSSQNDLQHKKTFRQEGSSSPSDTDSPFPTLALQKEQFEMIENLNRVGIVKFPVHILKVRHTHAAIVVRMQKSSFDEGKVVSSHWAGRFEI